MTHMHRKCSKCGVTQASSPELRMHRFPALNKNNYNYNQLISWAMFCYPEKDWNKEALSGLQKSSKVICSKHFADSAYTSSAKIRLSKFAQPSKDGNEENLHAPIAEQSPDPNLNVLNLHAPKAEPSDPNLNVLNLHAPIAEPSDTNLNVLNLHAPIAEPSDPNLNVLNLHPPIAEQSPDPNLNILGVKEKLATPGQLSLKPGINESIFENIAKSAKNNIRSDNVCFLKFEEVSIMKNICHKPKSDEIHGYQDHGEQGKSKVFASHALVFMLVWIRRKQKQRIAFYLSGDNVTADRLTVLIKEVLHECIKAGINVCATVCDLVGVNIRALENLGSTVKKPYFEFEGKEIVSLLDPAHLLKCLRDLFITYDVKLPIPVKSSTTGNTTGSGIASWKHIEQFFELDNANPHFVYAPKLTKRHLQPRGELRVELATQIFSHSVAMGIYSKTSTNELPAGAVATATFLEHFNNLYDLLNPNPADKEDGKPFKTNWTEKSQHKDFIIKSKKIIMEMQFIGCKTQPPTQLGWLKLLNGYERLWDNLNNIK